MVILLAVGFVFAVLTAFMMYYSEIHWIFKSLSLITFLLVGLLSYMIYVFNLGAPIPDKPNKTVEYVHHVLSDDTIILWARDKDKGNRLYMFPYDREEASELEKAKKEKESGKTVDMIFENGIPSIENIWVPSQNIIKQDHQ